MSSRMIIFDDNAFDMLCEDNLIKDNKDVKDDSYSDLFNNSIINSINFTSTNLQSDLLTEFENCDYYDFSQLIPYKGDDVKSNIAYLDMVSSFCKREKFKTLNKTINLKKKANIFYVRKIHRIKCSHRRNLNKKIKRNRIKMYVQEDLQNIFKGVRSGNLEFKQYDTENENTNNKAKKNTTNRNFRLFDKDVVIKKIMSNFLKFLKLIFECLINKVNSNNLTPLNDTNQNYIKYKKVCSVEQFKDFLQLKLSNFFELTEDKKLILLKMKKVNKLLDSKLQDLFSNYFVNSNYFTFYLINKIKTNYEQDYLVNFFNFIKKLF